MPATAVPTENTSLIDNANYNTLQRVLSQNSEPYRYGSLVSQEAGALGGDDEDFDTTYKYEAKLLAKSSPPLVVTYLLQYTYNLVTVIVAGRLGTNELAAASLASMTANITGLSVYEGLATALDTLASQAYGGGKKKLVGLHVQRMSAIMLAVTVPIGAIWLCSPWILAKIIPERELANLAGVYLRIYLIGAPGYGIFEACKRFTQAQGIFTASMVPVIICAPLNVLWNWLFVFKLGFGFEGAAMAVALSMLLQPIVYVIYVNTFLRSSLECWPGFSLKRCFQNWGHMLQLGLPGILMTLSEWLAFDILTLASSYLGTEKLAAQSVLMTIAVTIYHVPMPVSVAASTRFGNLIGHGALTAARKSVRLYYMVFFVIGAMDLLILSTLRRTLAKAFSDDIVVQNLVIQIMPLVAGAQMFDAYAGIANALLRGLGRQKIGGWTNLCVYYLWAVPLSLFLTFGPAQMDLFGLWIGPLSGLGIVYVIVSIYLKRADWSKAVEEARARGE